MRSRGSVAISALIGLICAPSVARAQVVGGKVSVSVAGGYNALLTSSPFPDSNSVSGPFMSIAPSLFGTLETPRTNHLLGYSLSLMMPLNEHFNFESRPLSYGNRLNYTLKVALDPLSNLNFSAGVTESPNNQFLVTGDPSQTPLDQGQAGNAINLNVNGAASIDRQLSGSMRLTQMLSMTYGHPIDPLLIRAQTISANAGLSLSKLFTLDTLSLSLSGSINYFTAGETQSGFVTEGRRQLTGTLTVGWNRPITHALTGSLSAGVSTVVSQDALAGPSFQPTGAASLNYNFDFAAAVLSYGYSSSLNVFTASLNFTHQVSLRFSLPLSDTGLSTSASAGYTHARPALADGTIGNPLQTLSADVGLNFTPKVANMVTASVRGQLQKLIPSELPETGFTRLGVTFSLTYSFPNALAARQQPYFSPGYSPTPALQEAPVPTGFEGPDGPAAPPGDDTPAPTFDPPP